MNVLYLGPPRPSFQTVLASHGDVVDHSSEPLGDVPKLLDRADLLVSYGYRHIVREDVIARFPSRIVNLHVSLLPWNRGADPNLWSFLENTPGGVTIHLIDRGVDTGPVIVQESVAHSDDDTLKTSYDRLALRIEALFAETWPRIRVADFLARPQPSGGSEHRLRDKIPYQHLLARGWDTSVRDLRGKALGEWLDATSESKGS